jgi:hypothetical protein
LSGVNGSLKAIRHQINNCSSHPVGVLHGRRHGLAQGQATVTIPIERRSTWTKFSDGAASHFELEIGHLTAQFTNQPALLIIIRI